MDIKIQRIDQMIGPYIRKIQFSPRKYSLNL